jgi:hypothetical protein
MAIADCRFTDWRLKNVDFHGRLPVEMTIVDWGIATVRPSPPRRCWEPIGGRSFANRQSSVSICSRQSAIRESAICSLQSAIDVLSHDKQRGIDGLAQILPPLLLG